MKKHRKPISAWENPVARKCAVIGVLALAPITVTAQILWSLIMAGVPETWDAILQLRHSGPAIKEAWIGRKQYRQNV